MRRFVTHSFLFLNLYCQGSNIAIMATEMNSEDHMLISGLPGNDKCVDCGSDRPVWGSPHLGILICLECSGRHRYE